jgi:pimeloyl-ACP methyl ester carboxylesterase
MHEEESLLRRLGNLAAMLFCYAAVLFCVFGCGSHASTSVENFSSSEEAIHFTNGSVTLAGTLVLPAGSHKVPAVVMFHGSGPQPRNLFLARWFAAHGFAALTYDKRGVGESTGNFRGIPFMELTGDGLAAIDYLKSRKEIDTKHIGVWGLSQGGWLGPLAALRSKDVAFVIDVSGPAVSPGEQMLFYYAKDLEAQGVSDSDIREATALRREIWNYMYIGNGYDEMEAHIKLARTKPWFNAAGSQQDKLFEGITPPSAKSSASAKKYNWFRDEAQYDPVPALEALHVPALFLFGDQDQLVRVDETVGILRATFAKTGKKDFTIQVFPNTDHGMYLRTGQISPEYLDTMSTWLADRLKAWY